MQKTRVTFLLDRSGSMQSIKQDTIGGYNTYLGSLQNDESADQIIFSLVQFDSTAIEKSHLNKPVKDIPKLDDASFQPRDMTPLIDAAYVTIKAVEKVVEGTDDKVVIDTLTDGHENASTQHTWDELAALVKEKRALGWQFNFKGVGIDAYNQSAKMGISRGSTMSTTFDSGEMHSAYAASAAGTMRFSKGLAATSDYTLEEKAKAGDYTTKVHQSPPPTPQPKAKLVDDLDLTK